MRPDDPTGFCCDLRRFDCGTAFVSAHCAKIKEKDRKICCFIADGSYSACNRKPDYHCITRSNSFRNWILYLFFGHELCHVRPVEIYVWILSFRLAEQICSKSGVQSPHDRFNPICVQSLLPSSLFWCIDQDDGLLINRQISLWQTSLDSSYPERH